MVESRLAAVSEESREAKERISELEFQSTSLELNLKRSDLSVSLLELKVCQGFKWIL